MGQKTSTSYRQSAYQFCASKNWESVPLTLKLLKSLAVENTSIQEELLASMDW